MTRAVLLACLPWLALLLASFFCAYGLMRVNRYRVRLGRLRELHADLRGGVQSLSFVLTLPFFVMLMLFIVQVSQLTIATVAVHYAAYAGVRSASVWIPADLGTEEGANRISSKKEDEDAENVRPIHDPYHPDYGPTDGGMTFVVNPGSPKYEKIATSAVIGCMSISPSRTLGVPMPPEGSQADAIVQAAYEALVPTSDENLMIPVRLRNKLAYAMENTDVEVRFFHKNREPPLPDDEWQGPYFLPYDEGQFYLNELGFQDLVTVTVKHKLALLPGPGRLLKRRAVGPDDSTDEISETVDHTDYVYFYPLEASATMGIEGQIPVIPYVHY